MIPASNNLLLTSADEGYNLTRSLRFRKSASTYLNRTMTTATDAKKWTWSGWVKRGSFDQSGLIASGNSTTDGSGITFVYGTGASLCFYDYISSTFTTNLVSTQVFRDPAAWYHIVVAVDTTQATASNRVKMYVNGTQITSFSAATYPALNSTGYMNSGTYATTIGREGGFGNYYDGYLTEVNFIDGQALTPSSFGSTNTLTGVWQPARYGGTYGTNGFYLPFTDNSALTTSSNVGLGKDFSGNGNYFTTNNISITAGVTYDSMTDVPTLTSATAANYCTWNPIAQSTVVNGTVTRSNGNLTSTDGGTTYGLASIGTIASTTGKFYWEVTLSAAGDVYANIGVVDLNSPLGAGVHTGLLYAQNGTKNSGSNVFASGGGGAAYGASYTVGDVIGVALDLTAGTITFYKNNTSQGVAYTGISGNYTPAVGDGQNTTSYTFNLNCGQRPFAYTPPTGYVALNTYNLPTSTIVKGNTVMDATLYTGNGSTQTITNAAGFQPDLVWMKDRSAAYEGAIFDSVRGTGLTKSLTPSSTRAESGNTTDFSLTSFNSNGFSLASTSGANPLNRTGDSYVGWQWQAGQGTTSSNTSGSITSTVSVNASAGFSVVAYTGTGVAATVGHGLGVAPQFIIVKIRNTVAEWYVKPVVISGASNNTLKLNSTDAATTANNYWNSTAPTSSVFSLGTDGGVNSSGNTFVAYCWTPIAGYSAFGSLTTNGSADNTFVYTGFKPRWIMWKRTDGANAWGIVDTARSTYNVTGPYLLANASDAEGTATLVDILSNGFKFRDSGFGAGQTYIYMAFAESPFKQSLAR